MHKQYSRIYTACVPPTEVQGYAEHGSDISPGSDSLFVQIMLEHGTYYCELVIAWPSEQDFLTNQSASIGLSWRLQRDWAQDKSNHARVLWER